MKSQGVSVLNFDPELVKKYRNLSAGTKDHPPPISNRVNTFHSVVYYKASQKDKSSEQQCHSFGQN